MGGHLATVNRDARSTYGFYNHALVGSTGDLATFRTKYSVSCSDVVGEHIVVRIYRTPGTSGTNPAGEPGTYSAVAFDYYSGDTVFRPLGFSYELQAS